MKKPSTAEKNDLLERRRRLHIRIAAYEKHVAKLAVFDGGDELEIADWKDKAEEGVELSDGMSDSDDEADQEVECPEHAAIFLPSRISPVDREKQGLTEMGRQEASLRIGQINDALQGLRVALGEKSIMLRTHIRNADSQHQMTRAWAGVTRLEVQVQKYVKRYQQARKALVSLDALDPQFQEITKDNLKMPGDITHENRVGQRSDTMAWFWRLDTAVGDMEDSPRMEECMCFLS
jgi:hypothetical protein